jgi:hypothetical protein
MSRDLRKIQLRFGNHKIFEKILKGMDVPTLEVLLKDAEDNPELIYYPEMNWSKSRTKIYMKVFEPGVKESLSRHSATARILAASAYMISRPCLSIRVKNQYRKVSLYKALLESFQNSIAYPKLPIEKVFIHHAEYEDLWKTIQSFHSDHAVQPVKLRTRNKHQVTVIERESFDVSIIELCKQAWFTRGGRTGLSSSQVERKWAQIKALYPFLQDSREETEEFLEMSVVQLKNFLDSLGERPRKVTLLDSAAKGGSLKTVLSRVYWPSTKLLLKDESEDFDSVSSIRSELFSICTHWMPHASKLKAIAKVLSESKTMDSESVPHRLKKLKIMRGTLEGKDKHQLILSILRDKLGAVGFFTISQQGWGWNRTGYGEWKGKILESSCVIEFNDSICTKITIDKLTNASELGHQMSDFIASTCSSYPSTYQDSDHWLSHNGRINGGRSNESYSYCS